ncbi:glycosyltransferase [Cryobacterium sp. CG_9.6]|uniref:glycosyltransferase n=1 Tax=Cryobacterium sp. CG_9.6 TaxID=2760710 RepID=UPI002476A493|nr:glycosyltransferase [Cryobacterium sp. CG_9.6]
MLTIVIPTFNERANIAELLRRIEAVVDVDVDDTEVLFVDDSTDDTEAVIHDLAFVMRLPIRVIHRALAINGLSGAVTLGLRASRGTWCIVMDGDLQHPPEMIPSLLATARSSAADVVVASRYRRGGSADGLNGFVRHASSSIATALTRSMFPRRLRDCSDPMTGFFLFRREAVDLDALKPRGFKILLEILARNRLTVVEESFSFGARTGGTSKASLHQGWQFLVQLAALRFGRLSRFATIGAVGAMANIGLMAAFIGGGMEYLQAASIAAILTILGNFALQEKLVFADLRAEGKSFRRRFAFSIGFNAAEAAARLPLLWLIVDLLHVPSLLAQGATLVLAFLARFVFHARVVYRPRREHKLSENREPSQLMGHGSTEPGMVTSTQVRPNRAS